MSKRDRLQGIVKRLNKVEKAEVLKFASQNPNKFIFLQSQFPTLNTLMRGFPKGRFTVLAGPSQVGKTALMLQVIAHLQRIDPDFTCVWTDLENSWESEWASRLGIDLDRLLLLTYSEKNQHMEDVMDIGRKLLKERAVDLMVIDSIGAMLPKKDVESKSGERSFSDSNMLNLQTKIGEVFRQFNVLMKEDEDFTGTAIVLIGHVYHVPTTTGVTLEEVRGGNAVKHWAHIRIAMRRGPKADWPDEIEVQGLDGKKRKVRPGFSARIKLDKTKANPNEGQEILLPFYHGRGFDYKGSTISAAIALGVVARKSDTSPMYESNLLPDGVVRGKGAVEEFFLSNEEAYMALAEEVDRVSSLSFLEREEDVTDNNRNQSRLREEGVTQSGIQGDTGTGQLELGT